MLETLNEVLLEQHLKEEEEIERKEIEKENNLEKEYQEDIDYFLQTGLDSYDLDELIIKYRDIHDEYEIIGKLFDVITDKEDWEMVDFMDDLVNEMKKVISKMKKFKNSTTIENSCKFIELGCRLISLEVLLDKCM